MGFTITILYSIHLMMFSRKQLDRTLSGLKAMLFQHTKAKSNIKEDHGYFAVLEFGSPPETLSSLLVFLPNVWQVRGFLY
jgi:hypothetical protein